MQEVKELEIFYFILFFYSNTEKSYFDIEDVINRTLCEKLIHRHPHIYSDTKVGNEYDVKNWEKLKLKKVKNLF